MFLNSPRDIPVHPELGINVRKIFTDPQRFDLALWLQGTGLHPFLEKGERTKGETWMEIMEFDDEGELSALDVGQIDSLFAAVKKAVQHHQVPLEVALKTITSITNR